jgi:pyrroloquinoline quinone (PQQ) biosynthesis protein C
MDFWDRFAAVAAERNVLEHSFYTRWSEGSLTREELAVYSGQYRHAVVALAAASRGAAPEATGALREHLEEHAAEEHAHVELWDCFVAATGGDAGAEPTAESADCAAAWEGRDRDLTSTLVALYAIESAQPKISEVKQQGLVDLYGFEKGPATDYFELHATLDGDHAEAHRAFIEPALKDADHDALLDAAREVLDANWKLLDGVERLNC